MIRQRFTITKVGDKYAVFEGSTQGEPMDEMSEDHLYGWLRTRGFSDKDASELIDALSRNGSVAIEIPT